MVEADDGRWFSRLLDGRDDPALHVSDAVWNSALSAAFDEAHRPDLDDLIPDDRFADVAAAAAPFAAAPAADWPDHEDVATVEDQGPFPDADDERFSFDTDDEQRPNNRPHDR